MWVCKGKDLIGEELLSEIASSMLFTSRFGRHEQSEKCKVRKKLVNKEQAGLPESC